MEGKTHADAGRADATTVSPAGCRPSPSPIGLPFAEDTLAGGLTLDPAALLAPRTDVSELRLKLFIAGDSPRSRAAATHLARVCHEHLHGQPEIETIDVLLHPDQAEAYGILATPTVVRDHPPPRRRATGDLRDAAQLLAALALPPSHPT